MKGSADGEKATTGRRGALAGLASGIVALTGCVGRRRGLWPPDEEETDVERTPVPSSGVPRRERGIEEWGRRLNDHARRADIDWKKFEDDDITLRFGMGLHPYSVSIESVKSYFEDLTGIEVVFEKFTEDQYWIDARENLSEATGRYDGAMVHLWPAARYHYGDGGNPWVRDLTQFMEDERLTDRDWLHMEDFHDQTISSLTFQNPDGSESLVGFPNTVEVFGCVGLDWPTFEKLGLQEPGTVEELAAAARTISEADTVYREGIVSTTSDTPYSSANWGTMFRTYDANWIDRRQKEGTLDSDAGVASLEQFATLLREYGPENPETYDWYGSQNAFSEGRVGMIYDTPQRSGILQREQMKRTKWLPPLQGPNGEAPVVAHNVISTGISRQSEHPRAAWLFIQWANSREANYMLSTKQWKGDDPRAGYARLEYIAKRDDQPPIPGMGYLESTRAALENVPEVDSAAGPPVPYDIPQNMDIMRTAAAAMNRVVGGSRSSKAALGDAASTVTDYAKQIPDYYL